MQIKLILAGDDIHYHWNCVRIDGMEEVRCIVCLCEHSVFLIDNYEIGQEGEIAKLAPPVDADGNPIASPSPLTGDAAECRRWSYSDVVEVAKRRYLLRPAALELFLSDGTSHLLVVNVEQRESVFQHLVDKSPAIRSTRFLKAGHFTLTGDLQLSAMHATIAPISKQWQAGDISNFEYLIALNSVAGRTYNDLSQYPVFPWVVKDYDSPFLRLHDPSTYRDLSKPMGALTEPRAAIFKQRYKETLTLEEGADGEGYLPGYMFGTHYSSAAVVLYYLLRCEPFTQHVIAFQSGRFDRPDRLFHSIKQSYLSASQLNVMDVKELIPEFFSSSDFLVNGNALKLGVRQDALKVNDVLLPRWAQGSARQFIRLHRAALESDYVSAHLHHWVDLIFGFQQQGKDAVAAQNVFHYLTYAGYVDVDQIGEPMRRAATIEQIRSFGQTPTQLFTSPHPPKKVVPRLGALFRSTLLHRFRATKSEVVAHAVGSLFVSEGDGRVYVTRPGFLILPTPAAPSSSAHFGVLRLLSQRRARLPPSKAKSTIGFVAWGFPDRSVRVGLVGPNQGPSGFAKAEAVQYSRAYLNLHDAEAVGVVAVPEVECGLLVTAGTEDCVVSVWKAEPLSTGAFGDYAHYGSLYGHSQPVTCLAVSRAFSLVASGSADSTVVLWDLNRRESVRQLRVVPYGAVITALSFDHISGSLAIASRSPDTLSVVDVNGVLLAQYPDIRRIEAMQNPPSTAAAADPAARSPDEGGHHQPHAHSISGASSPMPPHPLLGSQSTAELGGVHPGDGAVHSRGRSQQTLSMRDPISCLHVVDAAGYHFLNSLLLLVTGHRSGRVKLWYVTFDALHPTPGLSQSASSTLGSQGSSTALSGSTSSLPAPAFSDSGPLSSPPHEASAAEAALAAAKVEEEHKTAEAASAEQSSSVIHHPPPPASLVVSPSQVEPSPAVLSGSEATPSPTVALTDADKALPGAPLLQPTVSAASPSAVSPSATSGGMKSAAAAAAPYSGDLHIPEEFDAGSTPLMSPTLSPTPPQPPLRCWHLRPVAEWHRHQSPVTGLYVTSDCSSVYSGDSHGAIIHWSLPVSEEAKVNTSGLMGIGQPPLDAPCLCKAEKGKAGVHRTVVRRYCVCHPKTCRQVVCDHCTLDHIRSRHSPAQHRLAVLAVKQKAQREAQSRARAEEEVNGRAAASSTAAQSTSSDSSSPPPFPSPTPLPSSLS